MDVRATPHKDGITRRLRCERGVGLIELLTVLPMLAVVLLGIYALYNVGAKSQQETNNRVRSLVQQQSGLERISREMRQSGRSPAPPRCSGASGTTARRAPATAGRGRRAEHSPPVRFR
jgi:Tfp pilus assembly protein PilW